MSQWGRITLWDAAADGNVDLVKRRLKMELSKINAQDSQGKTALHEASRWNHAEVVQLLIDEGADPDVPDTEGATPLHTAARFGQLDAVRALLKNHASIDFQDYNGNTPLHSASGGGHPEVVRFLVEQRADRSIRNGSSKYAKDIAANPNTSEVFQNLK